MSSTDPESDAAPLEVDAVLDVVLASARRIFEGEGGSIMLLVGPEELEVVASPSNPAALGARVRFGDGIAGRVAETCDPALISGRDDTRTNPVDSGMSVPLMHDDRIFGVLNINAAAGRTFTDHDLVSATDFAAKAADALAAARLYEVDRRDGVAQPERHLDAMLKHLKGAGAVDFVEPGEVEPVNAMAIARSIAEREDSAGRPTGVRGPGSAMVQARPVELRRVLMELIDNGHRHGEAPVRVIFESDGDEHIVLTVADSGPGVPAKDRNSVFEPFGRLERETDGAGIGLGLTIARRLVESMGGSMVVVDTPVGGAAFRVRLRAA
jgi:hypothetical protein